MHAGKNPETGRYNKKFDVPRSVAYNRWHPDTPLSNRPSQRFIDWLNNYLDFNFDPLSYYQRNNYQ